MNIYQENVFQWLAHRRTHRLWKERQREGMEMETAGRSSRSTKRWRVREEKTRGDRSDWHRAKGRAEGWALFTRPQAAAITLLGELIQAPNDSTAQNVS